MTGLISLPTELLQRVFSHADFATCKRLRLTCQLLGNIGTECIFREALLTTKKGSSEKFAHILAVPELARCVSKFHLDCSDSEYWSWMEVVMDDMEKWDEGILGSSFPNAVLDILKRLPEFHNLRDVAISFHTDEDIEDEHLMPHMSEIRRVIMKRFLQSLVSLPQLPQHLFIRNLQDMKVTGAKVVANLQKVLGALRSLRMSLTTEDDPMKCPELGLNRIVHSHSFWKQVPTLWLKPTLSNLQHLTLQQDMYFGFYPKLDLSGIHFPNLKTLALGKFTFVHDSQLEWILSHGPTLTGLYLADCPILFEVFVDFAGQDSEKTLLDPAAYSIRVALFTYEGKAAYEKRWHHYFRAFQERLPHLSVFRFRLSERWWRRGEEGAPFEMETMIQRGCEESYLIYDEMTYPQYVRAMESYWIDHRGAIPRGGHEMKPSAEDKTALLELCAKVRQNAGKSQ